MQPDADGLDESWDGDLAAIGDLSGIDIADLNAAGAEFGEANAAQLGSGARFKALVARLRAKGAKNPEALAAAIGRKKFGASKFGQLAGKARKAKGNRSMPQRETRLAPLEFDRDEHGFMARLVTYGPPDSYKTRWQRGVFTESVERHKPVLAWGHNWADPIGRLDDYDDRSDGPYGHFRLDDGDYVPRAKQALYQLRSGTLTDVSVGILRRADKPYETDTGEPDGTTVITRADLDETSLVLRGAVSGAQVVASTIRSGQGMSFDQVVELSRRVKAGEMAQDDALAMIALLGAGGDAGAMSSTGSGQTIADADARAEKDKKDAEIRAALAEADLLTTRRSW